MKTATPEDIHACFRLLLGRDPNPEEISAHFGRVGMPLEFVVSIFVQGPEFHQRWLPAPGEDAEPIALDGFTIYVARTDQLIAPGIRHRQYEPETTLALVKYMGEGAVVDIGANCGYFSLVAASRGVPVYAFEPLQRNLRLLHAAKIHNRLPHLEIIAAAAGDDYRTAKIFAGSTNGTLGQIPSEPGTALQAEYVATVPVDAVISPERKVSLIKIDVEGYEYRAIRGAIETIRRNRPVILSEFSPTLLAANGVPGEAYLNLLRSLGYHLSRLGRPDITTDEALLELPAGVSHIDILALPH